MAHPPPCNKDRYFVTQQDSSCILTLIFLGREKSEDPERLSNPFYTNQVDIWEKTDSLVGLD